MNFQEIEDDFSIPTSSVLSRTKKPAMGQEEIMELLWHNGQVVAQTQKLSKKNHLGETAEQREIRSNGVEETAQNHLFLQEDEMASWLQYPLDVPSFDLIFSAPPPSTPVTPPRSFTEFRPPPIPPPQNPQRFQDFLHISRNPTRNLEAAAKTLARESTVVESNETPKTTGPKSMISHPPEDHKTNILLRSGKARETDDMAATVSSSPSCSGASFSTSADRCPPSQKPASEDRKRRGREDDCQMEDIEFEATKQSGSCTSTKKSRAAQVHNLSERRRRDRINEKMRLLQELIPRCNKSDKASMLDEAIEYLKSLQLQVQMMSMGFPMMYPGMQQYQYMPMMGMGMGMNRPIMPYPSMLPNPAAAGHLNPCFPMPPFHLPSDPSRIQLSNTDSSMLNSVLPHNLIPPRLQTINNPCRQFFGLQQSQPSLPQNQAAIQPNTSNNRDICNPDTRQSG